MFSVITNDERLGDFSTEAGIVMAEVIMVFYFDSDNRIQFREGGNGNSFPIQFYSTVHLS